MENLSNLANTLNRERVQQGGWSSDESTFDFLTKSEFYSDFEDEYGYRCVMPEGGNISIWLPKDKTVRKAPKTKETISVGLQFPVDIRVTQITLPKRLKEYITEEYVLPSKENLTSQLESDGELSISNTNHTLTINGVFYRFPGEIYKILKSIENSYKSKVVKHSNNCGTGFVSYNILRK